MLSRRAEEQRQLIPAYLRRAYCRSSHRTCRARDHAEVKRAEGSVPGCWKASAHSRVSSNAVIAGVTGDRGGGSAGGAHHPVQLPNSMRGGMAVATVRQGAHPFERGGAAWPHRTFFARRGRAAPSPHAQNPEARACGAARREFAGEMRRDQADLVALATRALPAAFFSILRTAAVLPCGRDWGGRGMARRAFFFSISTLRWCLALTGIGLIHL